LILRRGGEGLQVLFIQRASRGGDIYSGDIAFPGGKREGNESDEQTAIRETMEEIGLNLSDADSFTSLGAIDDRFAIDILVRCFVYIQVAETTPPVKLEPAEVASCFWCCMEFLQRPHAQIVKRERWARARFDGGAGRSCWMRTLTRLHIPALLGLHVMLFNCIDITMPQVSHTLENTIAEVEKPSYRLWGLTMAMLSDFMVQASLRPDPFTIFIHKAVFGIPLVECVFSSDTQNIAYAATKAISMGVGWGEGIGSTSRALLAGELALLGGLAGAAAIQWARR
jgi:8-oxo-dGTP pyrophosphatase MutT (NUDIX family)